MVDFKKMNEVKDSEKKISAALQVIMEQQLSLAERKNSDYGNALIRSFRDFGMASPLVMVSHKVSRLYNLRRAISDGKTINFESIEDSLLDLMNYCVMAVVLCKTKRDINAINEAEKNWNVFLRMEYKNFCKFTMDGMKITHRQLPVYNPIYLGEGEKPENFIAICIERLNDSYNNMTKVIRDPKAYDEAIPVILEDIFTEAFLALAFYRVNMNRPREEE